MDRGNNRRFGEGNCESADFDYCQHYIEGERNLDYAVRREEDLVCVYVTEEPDVVGLERYFRRIGELWFFWHL